MSEHPRSILAEFVCVPSCPTCAGHGHVCERHPDRPWLGDSACDCGAPGMPCPDRLKRLLA